MKVIFDCVFNKNIVLIDSVINVICCNILILNMCICSLVNLNIKEIMK